MQKIKNKSQLNEPKLRFKGFKDIYNKYNIGNNFLFLSGLSGMSISNFLSGNDKYIEYIEIFKNSRLNNGCGKYFSLNGSKQNKVIKSDILVTNTSETINEIGTSSIYIGDNEKYLNSFCFILRNECFNIDSEYVNFLLNSPIYRKLIVRLGQGSTRYNLSKNEYAKINLKLPSLIEQHKITKFFTLLDKQIELWERKLQLNELINLYFTNIIFKKYEFNTKIKFLIIKTDNVNKMNIFYRNGCISKSLGVSFQDSFFKNEIKSKKQTSHKILYQDEYVYNPARINIGSIARNKYEEPLLFSPMYQTFKLIDTKNVDILDIFFKSHRFISKCKQLASGSVRNTLNWDDFSSIDLFDLKNVKYDYIKILNLLKFNIELTKKNIRILEQKKLFYLDNLFI